MISKLRASGHYNVYASSPDAEFVKALWNSVSGGITRILDVYIKGENPFYAAIDSISFPADDRNFLADVKNMLADELRDMDGKAFYEVPVNVSISALLMNQRDEAARYEPLDKGINKTAIEGIKHVNWDNYQYSVILVPGQGPEKDGVSIDPQSIVRCELASDYYRAGAAPFMVVSGGHVHPNKTPFCEAIEMKKYMTGKLNIPEHVIFVEPHARHTTTNMRNTARMIYRFNMPDDKKILIVTDPVQNTYIDMMENRFMTELGCVPYRDLKKLTANTSEYFPDRNALQCNPMDPLDP
ncbi:MAG: YdcF family protein [Deltaproteobacteria bacterium]|nr:YdcF family protein [Deltaproteobacteria bacterium]